MSRPARANAKPDVDPLRGFHPAVKAWFRASFEAPTPAQVASWPLILGGRSVLLLAPTGSGKTLAAFLAALEGLMFSPLPARGERLRVVYVSPLKALGVDVEHNLRAPIAGILAAARRLGVEVHEPAVAVRSGDTPSAERARFARRPSDILITTPESLYLLLTSRARESLRSVSTVIVDEIHTLVPNKRGTHLFLSLERLEALATGDRPLQRVGLSATQRPLDEVARLLGGGTPGPDGAWQPRPVEIVDAGSRKPLELRVEVPVEDMSQLPSERELSPASSRASAARSIWPALHPRLVELVRAHRSTMIFVNSRRVAERLANAINEVAGEELALAHHGSVAKEKRRSIEGRLKAGTLPAIVATSSLELGIDMGAVELVIQIEAPPSVASGVQRIGRAGHGVSEASRGVLFPKFRGDLLACAAAVERMHAADVEETFYPRCPLDVLAQQIIAAVSVDSTSVDELYTLVRRAAPYAELGRGSFEAVLDLASGRYPSDEFAALRPRLVWDRARDRLKARQGSQRLAVTSGGTIPDRGLYGVFLAGAEHPRSVRVGELDEEMVFESRVGDVFLLGASSWRIEEITHDRVLVTPAPGTPGKMPFWHGDRPGRAPAFGRAVGALARELAELDEASAIALLGSRHGLDEGAARNLVEYVRAQSEVGAVPTDTTLVVEYFTDEVGDQRVCLLTPFGARVHAPWSIVATALLREARPAEVDSLWSDDGLVFRLPEADAPPPIDLILPDPDIVEGVLLRALGGTSLFAARFRENAARALLLPRRRPGQRTALWAQRRRAADLLRVASSYPSFPILLETYRDCLRDVFDVPALVDLLRRVRSRELRVVELESRTPSPFAASLLFSYVGNFLYEGDAPLAERRAQALSIDHDRLRELLGEVELRELFDAATIQELERTLQHLSTRRARSADALHDVFLDIGDLTREEARGRCEPEHAAPLFVAELAREGRIFPLVIAGEERFCAAEDVAKLRDALDISAPPGVPPALLGRVDGALADVIARFARTHGPFSIGQVASRFGLEPRQLAAALTNLERQGRVIEGEFVPGGRGPELCDSGVLRQLKQKTLARLRREIEPVDAACYARFLSAWHELDRPRRGLDGLLATVEKLQGVPLSAKVLFEDVLPARLQDFRAADLDLLCAQGEVTWRGVEKLGPGDGKIALYLSERQALIAPPPRAAQGALAARVRGLLSARGALFFSQLHAETGGFARDLLAALWELVWSGEVTNDTLAPMRSLVSAAELWSHRARPRADAERSHRKLLPGSEGRWWLAARAGDARPPETDRSAALTELLLERHGVVTREAVHAEGVPGGFAAVYEVLKALEQAGRVRRGYFVAGLGAAQFARAGAEDRLRAEREGNASSAALVLAATDPANPYGATLPWPQGEPRPLRVPGAFAVLSRGALVGYLARGERHLTTFLPDSEPLRSRGAGALAGALARLVESGRRRALLITNVDVVPTERHELAGALLEHGFSPGSRGFLKRGERRPAWSAPAPQAASVESHPAPTPHASRRDGGERQESGVVPARATRS